MWSPAGSVARPCSPSAPRPGRWHDYLTDIVVIPAHQHRGLGSRIGAALTASVESVPFENTWVGLFPTKDTGELYARFGDKAQRPSGPAMYRWLNRSDA